MSERVHRCPVCSCALYRISGNTAYLMQERREDTTVQLEKLPSLCSSCAVNTVAFVDDGKTYWVLALRPKTPTTPPRADEVLTSSSGALCS